jgi:hypothetical protein
VLAAGQYRILDERGDSGDVTLTGNTAVYSSTENRVSRKTRDLACAKAGLDGLLNAYTQLM